MSLLLDHPQQEVERVTTFLKELFKQQGKQKAVIAVSGGIDSALSLILLTQALGPENVIPVFLPYDTQSVEDSHLVTEFTAIPKANWVSVNIQPMVALFMKQLGLKEEDEFRKGNIMARCRMIVVYDLAKKYNALVCGTENKSEKYLGYFTRFGDEASDVEPIQQFYKTQVRQLAEYLHIPSPILNKAPSAGLWQNQTDEQELGYTYAQADVILAEYIDKKRDEKDIYFEDISKATVAAVIARVKAMQFKHDVPYILGEHHE